MKKNNRITFEEFSVRVEKVYNGRISVVKETFTSLSTGKRVVAHCNVHNIDFEPEARCLWKGEANCPLCSKEKSHKLHLLPWSKALEKFQRVYGDRFSYDENTYDGMKCEMSVHCNVCGETFRISPVHHLKYNNGGCPNCHKHRIVKCSCCGKEIEADWHINGNIKIYCEECRYKNILLRKYKYKLKDKNFDIEEKTKTIINSKHFCKICGRPLNEKQECDNEFCKNKNFERFGSLIKYFNFDKNKLGTVYVEIEFNRIRNVLYDMYWIQHMSSTLICKIFNYPSVSNLSFYIFKFLGIPSKTHQQSSKENIFMGRISTPSNFIYKDKYHTSWDNKTVYLRSSYEFDFAKILDELNIVYEVEYFRIRYFDTLMHKERIAIPDFYLPDTNTIIEIKSIFTLDVQNMKDKVAAYLAFGFKFKLILEHKECDLNELIQTKDNEKYKALVNKYRRRKTVIRSDGKFRWMHNNIERIKVIPDEVERYQQMGWILGALSPQKQKENIANGVQPCAELLDIENI